MISRSAEIVSATFRHSWGGSRQSPPVTNQHHSWGCSSHNNSTSHQSGVNDHYSALTDDNECIDHHNNLNHVTFYSRGRQQLNKKSDHCLSHHVSSPLLLSPSNSSQKNFSKSLFLIICLLFSLVLFRLIISTPPVLNETSSSIASLSSAYLMKPSNKENDAAESPNQRVNEEDGEASKFLEKKKSNENMSSGASDSSAGNVEANGKDSVPVDGRDGAHSTVVSSHEKDASIPLVDNNPNESSSIVDVESVDKMYDANDDDKKENPVVIISDDDVDDEKDLEEDKATIVSGDKMHGRMLKIIDVLKESKVGSGHDAHQQRPEGQSGLQHSAPKQ